MHAGSEPHSLMADAARLIAGAVCVWCERRPKAVTSHLCDECRRDDPDGVLQRAFQPQAMPAHIST
jgi:hypothetical protein